MSTLRLRNRPTAVKLPSLEKVAIAVASFVAGSMTTVLFGMHGHSPLMTPVIVDEMIKRRLSHELDRLGYHAKSNAAVSNGQDDFFPSTVQSFAVGMARTNKTNFVQKYDLGVPISADISKGEEDVLIIYSHRTALPDIMQTNNKKNNKVNNNKNDVDTSVPPLLDTHSALANCDSLNVILTRNPAKRRQCIALVPQYESFHIQKWMRVLRDKQGNLRDALDPKLNLTLVSRGHEPTGRQNFLPPRMQRHTEPHWKFLRVYLDALDSMLAKLKPVCKSIASKGHSVTVMVCNYGQSELLMNFVCAAKQRKLSLSNIIVFATDEKTEALAKSMGLTTFYDDRIFGSMPSEVAQEYGDYTFSAMMMAKVVSVHLITMLGYNVLFQDVDIVWYKNPLDYFEARQTNSEYFDMYFQDDGSYSVRFAPLAANSGFYYVRYNDKTQYFMNAMLTSGDLIAKAGSHQQVMIALLNEHTSLFGLRVKVLSKDNTEFPCGASFQENSRRFMKDFYAGKVHPYIFHMSWTKNKTNKVLFFRQMGDWYVHDSCIGKTMEDIVGAPLSTPNNSTGTVVKQCCSIKPLISCHFRDKPSKIPCKDSPYMDLASNGQGKSSFW